MKVIIVEDSIDKAKEIESVLKEKDYVGREDLSIASNIFDARRLLADSQFDLMILDLMLPRRPGENPEAGSGIDFLQEITDSDRLRAPTHVICCTGLTDELNEHEFHLKGELVHLVFYHPAHELWKKQLIKKCDAIERVERRNRQAQVESYDYDIAFITSSAVAELRAVLKVEDTYVRSMHPVDGVFYYTARPKVNSEKRLKVVACAAPQMGLTSTAVAVTKLINTFRPRYLCMCGIMAGIRDQSGYGDVILATEVFDYGSGKIVSTGTTESAFLPDPRHVSVDSETCALFQLCEQQQMLVDDIYTMWSGDKPQSKLKVLSGVIASGAAVVGHAGTIEAVRLRNRKLLGIDMEAYAVMYAGIHAPRPKPKVIVCKCVCDYADSEKGDTFHNYAAFVSAQFGSTFLKEYGNF